MLVFVPHLLTTALIARNLIRKIAAIIDLAKILKLCVTIYVIGVVRLWNFPVNDFHSVATSRVPVFLRLESILELHNLVSAWPLLWVIDETGIQKLVNEWVVYLHITYCHVHNVSLGARVLLVLTCAFKWIFLDHEIVQAASK